MSCSRTYLSLRGFSDRITGEQITALLDLEPSRTIIRGEPVNGPNTAPSKRNAWLLSTENWPPTTNVGTHLQLLAELLGDRKLPADGIDWDLFVYWATEEVRAVRCWNQRTSRS